QNHARGITIKAVDLLVIRHIFFFSSRRRHTRFSRDWSSDVCSSDLNRQWLDKHLQYALTSAQLYQSEARYQKVALYAAELAYNNERYADAIALTNALPDSTPEKTLHDANLLKGLAYLKLAEHKEAENIFADLLEQPLDRNLKQRVSDNLALAIYQQAEGHIKENRLAE